MNNYSNLQNIVSKINSTKNENLVLNEEAKKDEKVSAIILILALIGGFLANSSFFGFLAFTGIFENETSTLILGLLLIIVTYIINKKISSVLIQTFLIATFLSGVTCLIASLVMIEVDLNVGLLIVLAFSLVTFYIYNNFIIRLLSVISFIFIFTLSLLLINIRLYFIDIYIDIFVLISLYLLLKNEAKWLKNQKLCEFYKPLKYGLQTLAIYSFFSLDEFIDSLMNPSINYFDNIQYLFISNFLLLAAFFYWLVVDILKNRIKASKNQIIIILIPITLIVIGGYFDNRILYSLCCILLAFNYNEKLFFGASVIALIYTLFQFYYNLSMVLLHKSLLLMASGFVFLILYFMILKLTNNEKNNHSTNSI